MTVTLSSKTQFFGEKCNLCLMLIVGKKHVFKFSIRLKNELIRLSLFIIGTRLGTHHKLELDFYQ